METKMIVMQHNKPFIIPSTTVSAVLANASKNGVVPSEKFYITVLKDDDACFGTVIINGNTSCYTIHYNFSENRRQIRLDSNCAGQGISNIFNYIYFKGEEVDTSNLLEDIGLEIFQVDVYRKHKDLIEEELLLPIIKEFTKTNVEAA